MEEGGINAATPLRNLKGIGPRRAEDLSAAGLETIEDLLHVMPVRYEDREHFARIGDLVADGQAVAVRAEVVSSRVIRTRRRGFTIFETMLEDDSGSIRAIWYNQPYLKRQFRPERAVVVFGSPRADRYGRNIILENPDYEFLVREDQEGIHTGRIVPVYRRIAGLSSRMQRTLIHNAMRVIDRSSLSPPIPGDVSRRQHLIETHEALSGVHFPQPGTSMEELDRRLTPAHRSLAFEEMFLLQVALRSRRAGRDRIDRGRRYTITGSVRGKLEGELPFTLTAAQSRVVSEIADDLRAPCPMNRLLQGDVGSGKTAVAVMAMRFALANGYQAVMMAPTEILARQHYRSISALLDSGRDAGGVMLLTGSTPPAERRVILSALESGQAGIVVGTHALFEPAVRFHDLGLVVVDEQQRFGVAQRAAMAGKGGNPDILVMTATPIPRSLALTVYGDLDLSVIDEPLPGRTPVKTLVRSEDGRAKVYEGIRSEVEKGRQAYVVVPLVHAGENMEVRAAREFSAHLADEIFPDLEVGLLHGRMKGKEAEEVMQAFAAGEVRVLVATTVIEVGVDVPNATVMVIEHAERFGLSQLHQLRGRVGRGSERSFCVLMVGADQPRRESIERLEIMELTGDGFLIAEKDLELRGPGAVFGTEQHGLSDMHFLAVALRDRRLLDEARGEAGRWIERYGGDPGRIRGVIEALRPVWARRLELGTVG